MSIAEGEPLPLPQQFLLTDKVAIVTGAGKGIGAAIAVGLAEAGADVAVVARTRADLERVADQIRRRGRRALVLPADMNHLGMLPDLVESVAATFGGLDVVINNAGGSQSFPFLNTTIENLEASFHFNVSATFELSRLAVPHLLRRGGGSIVNISSVAGSRDHSWWSHPRHHQSGDLAPHPDDGNGPRPPSPRQRGIARRHRDRLPTPLPRRPSGRCAKSDGRAHTDATKRGTRGCRSGRAVFGFAGRVLGYGKVARGRWQRVG